MPWSIKKALNGESAAPVFLRGTVLALPIKAAAPRASLYTTP